LLPTNENPPRATYGYRMAIMTILRTGGVLAIGSATIKRSCVAGLFRAS
jgi:hypothetical protein